MQLYQNNFDTTAMQLYYYPGPENWQNVTCMKILGLCGSHEFTGNGMSFGDINQDKSTLKAKKKIYHFTVHFSENQFFTVDLHPQSRSTGSKPQ